MLIIEKIEKNIVTVENNDTHFNIEATEIAGRFKEGDIIVKKKDKYFVDSDATKKQREYIKSLEDSIWE